MNKLLILSLLTISIALTAQPADTAWYFQSPGQYNGIGVTELYDYLGKSEPQKKVIVAILDSGIDIEHEDLKDNIWVNSDEIPDNGIDDDKNGFVDDIHGWNFLGNKDGKNVTKETLEVTRLYAHYRDYFAYKDLKKLSKKDQDLYKNYLEYQRIVQSHRQTAKSQIEDLEQNKAFVREILDTFDIYYPNQELTAEFLDGFDPGDNQVLVIVQELFNNARAFGFELTTTDALMDEVSASYDEVLNQRRDEIEYRYNPDYKSRVIIGDDYDNVNETGYGNNDVRGGYGHHGTHVSGIVGASWNDYGVRGIARHVMIMPVRVVPNGDEHDKDVANAIRYAVENGADVINMSFGKGYSWDKKTVDKAVKYARKHDVLLIHGAGNDASDNDEYGNFPNATFEKSGLFGKKRADNWIEVGALHYMPGTHAVASFSNYGKESVDVFAPGTFIYSSTPENGYDYAHGTSMASPVVAGVAAVLRSYFPDLKAGEIKQAIMQSVTPVDGKVMRPGDNTMVEMSEISMSVGYVDLYGAFMTAANMSRYSGKGNDGEGQENQKPGKA